jgi:hypothetical protein
MDMADNKTGALTLKREYPNPRTLPTQPSWQATTTTTHAVRIDYRIVFYYYQNRICKNL